VIVAKFLVETVKISQIVHTVLLKTPLYDGKSDVYVYLIRTFPWNKLSSHNKNEMIENMLRFEMPYDAVRELIHVTNLTKSVFENFTIDLLLNSMKCNADAFLDEFYDGNLKNVPRRLLGYFIFKNQRHFKFGEMMIDAIYS
jgi:hypothetical protein